MTTYYATRKSTAEGKHRTLEYRAARNAKYGY